MDGAGVERPMLEAKTADERLEAEKARKQAMPASRADLYGEQLAPTLDPEKLKKAIAKEEAFQKNSLKHEVDLDDKKRKYNSFVSSEVTPEEMEAYRMRKGNDFNDPMAKFKDKGGGDEGDDGEEELLEYDPEADERLKGKIRK